MKFLIKHISRKLFLKTRAKNGNQIPLVIVNDKIGMSIASHGFYEKDLLDTILKALDFNPHEHTCVDVGANIGNHSVKLSHHFKKVLAFEPVRRNFKILELNTEFYDIIDIYNFGLSSKREEVQIYIPYDNCGGVSFEVPTESGNHFYSEGVSFKVYDDEFKERFAYVKIDVEGCEKDVLKGMKFALEKYLPVISFEYKHVNKDGVLDILKELGYERFFAPKKPLLNKIFRSGNLAPIKRLYEVDLPAKQDFSLVTTFHKDSPFQIKI